MPGPVCWRMRSMELIKNWTTQLRPWVCETAKLPEFLAANHGIVNEPSLRSAEPVSQHTDSWTKTNVYHMPLSFWGWLLCSISWTIDNRYKMLIISPLHSVQGRNTSTEYLPWKSCFFCFFDWFYVSVFPWGLTLGRRHPCWFLCSFLKHKWERSPECMEEESPTCYLHVTVGGFEICILMWLSLAGKWPGVWIFFFFFEKKSNLRSILAAKV